MKKGMTDRILQVIGLGLCFLYIIYVLYCSISTWIVTELRTPTSRSVTILGGMAAMTEGEVVRAERECTMIQYYHEWDGTDYRKVIPCKNADYPLKAKMPVIYGIGMGPGTCLAVGFYRRPMRVACAVGAALLLLGIALNFKEKGIRKNGEKKNYRRKLEDEYDSQRGSRTGKYLKAPGSK